MLEAHYEIGGCAHDWACDLDGRSRKSVAQCQSFCSAVQHILSSHSCTCFSKGKPIPSDRLESLTAAAAANGQSPPPVFKFEAGPSLYSGLSPSRSPNPLKSVFQMVGEEPEWVCYNTWGAHLPECPDGFDLSIGADAFKEVLKTYGGPTALSDWEQLAAALRPLTKGVMGLPSAAVRNDPGVLLTLGLKYPLPLLRVLRDATKITAPFDLDKLGVKDSFLKNYLDLLAFLLQGLPADQTLTAVVAYMVEDFYRPNAVMEYPKGGSGSLAKALSRAIEKNGGTVHTRAPVASVLVEEGRATGVTLESKSSKKASPSSSNNSNNHDGAVIANSNSGRIVRARKGVVSNADLYGTFKLVPPGLEGCSAFDAERAQLLGGAVDSNEEESVPLCKSFMHLHLAIKEDAYPGLREMIAPNAAGAGTRAEATREKNVNSPPSSSDSVAVRPLPPQWTVVDSWEGSIDAPGKVVVVSMPTLLDASMAPTGYHIIHAYAAGNEPFDVWEQFDTKQPKNEAGVSSNSDGGGDGNDASYRQNPAYEALKKERAEPLWRAIERRLPLIRQPGVCSVVQIGTPLTHKRFLRRYRGNYGPAIAAGNSAGLQFPGVETPLPGYYRCGDSTTSGIGVPAVASSGAQCANALLTVWEQLEMNAKIKM